MSQDDEHRLIRERRNKLDAMREQGIAYPNDFRRTALAAELVETYDDVDKDALAERKVEVSVAGRLMAKRLMGKTNFIKIQDGSGQIQAMVGRDNFDPELFKAFKGWDIGDIIGLRGTLFKTRTGEVTVDVAEMRLLTKSLRPLPEKFHGLSDQETRYRQRYVDLIMNEDSRKVFMLRTRLVNHVRKFLNALSFMEVETPMMQPILGGANARPFVTHHNALDMPLYLRIAPELYLKRLTVGGFERVYEINRNFRNEGLSTRHNPEFTMLEVYQAYGDFEDMMALTENLVRSLAMELWSAYEGEYQGEPMDLGAPFARLSVVDAVAKYNPDTFDPARSRDVDYLRGLCNDLGVAVDERYGAGKLLIEIFEKTAEEKLIAPTFITQYPTEVSPLSRCNDDDPFLTDRFEFFLCGREIANGFSELNDPEDQSARFKAQCENKDAGDDEAMEYDADYVRALEYGMPPAGGLGIGIDRLTMLFADVASIRDVLLFPHMRPETDADDR
jgi:lysyl-tRNA synthetase class 2